VRAAKEVEEDEDEDIMRDGKKEEAVDTTQAMLFLFEFSRVGNKRGPASAEEFRPDLFSVNWHSKCSRGAPRRQCRDKL
jgi:hypothetical protein